jgi:putative glutamine amidotransferase
MRAPLIGITTGRDTKRSEFYSVRHEYVRSVERAGGLPVVLVPGDPALLAPLLARLDGLVVTGGVDVAPALYGQDPHPTVTAVSDERDLFEIALVREAILRDLPLLGICRGMQVMNVALGGTLIQDLPALVGTGVSHDHTVEGRDAVAHAVSVAPGCRLASLVGAGELAVNSFHHQAVERLGEGLVETARAPDGVIEAMELPRSRFAVAVQWHPESFWRDFERFGELFRGLVRSADEKG